MRQRLSKVIAVMVVAIAPMLVAAPPIASADSGASTTTRLAGMAARLAGGQTHNCEILDNGSLTCWGSGFYGQLGYGNPTTIGDDELPAANTVNGGIVQLPGGQAAVAVDAGIDFTCVLLAGGDVTCFGSNSNGELGYGFGGNIGDNETPADNTINGGVVALPGGKKATAIAVGDRHTCALLVGGDITCWGLNASGQLGYGNTDSIGDNETPADNPTTGGIVQLPGGQKAIAISGGGKLTCAILADKTITCWGAAADGQLGYGNTNIIGDNETPAANPVNGGIVQLPGGLTATAIDVGFHHACAVLSDGTLTCWGAGNDAQLGYGNQFSIGDDETPATNPVSGGIVQLPGGQPVLSVTAGHGHTCAILGDASLACWGNGGNGQLGYGNTHIIGDDETPVANPVNGGAVPLPGGQTAVAVAAADSYTCAILDGGQTTCWGYGGIGQLGYGNGNDIGDNELIGNNPVNGGFVRLPGPDRVVEVTTGYSHTCVLISNGRVTCWGYGADGELGTGTTATIGDTETAAANPVNGGFVRMPSGQGAVDVSAGSFHTCALLVGGEITCWGYGGDGALGYGNTNNIGDTETPATNPANFGIVLLPSGHTAVAIAAGDTHTCAILDNGEVSCWGDGSDGRLGYGNTLPIGDNEDPSGETTTGGIVSLPGGKGAVAIDAAGASTCAILTTGRVTCWGSGANGRLGYGNTNAIGDTETPATNPVSAGLVALPGNLTAIDISVGANHACAVLSDHTLTCWGYGGAGQLGYGNGNSIGDTETPATNPVSGGRVQLPGAQTVAAVEPGSSHTCAQLTSGDVACWGNGPAGQLGYGNTDIIGDDETPAANAVNGGVLALPGGQDALRLDTNSAHSCAVLADGAVSCWGNGTDGRLGYGNTNHIGNDETPTGNPVNGGRVPLPRSVAAVDYRPLVPARLLDTRATGVTIDHQNEGPPSLTGSTFMVLPVRGRGGVPVDATSATLSIAALGTSGGGYLTVWPCGATMPLASSLNYQAGVNTANTVITKLATNGTVCIFSSQTTNLIVDVVGNTPRSSSLVTLNPARLADTRPTGDTIDNIGEKTGVVTAGSTLHVQVANRGEVPGLARNVVLNVTAVGPAAGGYVTVHPCLATTPLASNLNYTASVTAANLVITQVDGSNEVCLYTSQNTHLIVDVVGYYANDTPGLSWAQSFSPTRLADTRTTGTTIDGRYQATGQLAAGGVLTVQVANRFPTNQAAVATLNITAVGPTAGGYLTVWPCDQTQPTASSLNYIASVNRAVEVLSKLSATGTVCVFTSQPTHLIVDITGATL